MAAKLITRINQLKALSYDALFGWFYGVERHDDYRHITAQEINVMMPMPDFQNRFRSDCFFASVALLKSRKKYKGIINNESSDKAFGYYPIWAEFALEPGQ